MASDDDSEAPFDPRRPLCSDGGCVGIIGPDGRCNLCGQPAEPMAAAEPVAVAPDAPGSTDDGYRPGDGDGAGEDDATGTETSFDPRRRLCSDGSCIGVIGGDNRCRVCGKPA